MSVHHDKQPRVCIVGSGMHFASGISQYTLRLSNSLSKSCCVSAILMRRLLPARFYPGRERVGANLTWGEYDDSVEVFDGVDWYWLPSILWAILFLLRQKPNVIVFQWWTGTVLHSYLLLALIGRLIGAQLVVEFHEVLDTAETKLFLARTYVQIVAPLFMGLAGGYIIHSEYDRPLLEEKYRIGRRQIALIPHGPYDHYVSNNKQVTRTAPESCCNLLYFGVIRPFKGVEDLVKAFDAISEEDITRFWLTVVGETWEGWTLPNELIDKSRYRERITFINRYVHDTEVSAIFAGADAVVLPYHRSSASGPLHIAMSWGLPIVLTSVGGLIEATADYEGVILVPPRDSEAIRSALMQVSKLPKTRFSDPHSWNSIANKYGEFLAAIMNSGKTPRGMPL